MADTPHIRRGRAAQTPRAPRSATIIPFPARPRRPTAPPFDKNNPAHVEAWEALFAFGQSMLRGS